MYSGYLITKIWTKVRAKVQHTVKDGNRWVPEVFFVLDEDTRSDEQLRKNRRNCHITPFNGWKGVSEVKGNMEEPQIFFLTNEQKEEKEQKDAIEVLRRKEAAEEAARKAEEEQAAYDKEVMEGRLIDDKRHENGKVAKACDFGEGRTCWVLFEDGQKVVCDGVIHDEVKARLGRKVDLQYFEKKYNGGIIKS